MGARRSGWGAARTAGAEAVDDAGADAAPVVCAAPASGGGAAAAGRAGAEAGAVCALASPANSTSAATSSAVLRPWQALARRVITAGPVGSPKGHLSGAPGVRRRWRTQAAAVTLDGQAGLWTD